MCTLLKTYFRSGQLFDHLYISKMKCNTGWKPSFSLSDFSKRFISKVFDLCHWFYELSVFLLLILCFRLKVSPGYWYLRSLMENKGSENREKWKKLKKYIVGNCFYERANICEFPMWIYDELKKNAHFSIYFNSLHQALSFWGSQVMRVFKFASWIFL